jgi:hypothetical protein
MYALSEAERMSVMLPVVADAFDLSLDGDLWRRHWQAWCVGLLLFSCIGVVAGVGLSAKRLWGLGLLASLFTLLLLVQTVLLMSGYAKYAFEIQGPLDLAVAAALACLLWPWYLIARGRASRQGPPPREPV